MGSQDGFTKTSLRVPPDLHDMIHAAAEANGRTFNAELLERLRSSFMADPLESRVAELERQIATLLKRKGQ